MRRAASRVGLIVIAMLTAVQTMAQTIAPGSNVSILYAESLRAVTSNAASRKTSTERLSFNAHGRHFDLQLEPNDRIASTSIAKTSPGALTLLRGSLTDEPDSWVRLARLGTALHGMVWDGTQLFLIEPASAVRDSLSPAMRIGGDATVIFRLADTLIAPGTASCAAPVAGAAASDASATVSPIGKASGQDAYNSLLTELKSTVVGAQATGAIRRLEISAIGDAEFRAQYPSDDQARNEILIRLNNVDGIYSSQLGVAVQAPVVNVTASATQSLSTTTSATALLNSLKDLRAGSAELRARGLTHLFTGRDLDGTTGTVVGLAFRDSLCRADFGVGLTEARGRGSWFESLIAAHEIGHNFGAVHDGEVPTEVGEPDCRSTPANQFLMSPEIQAEHSTFSQCTLNIIRPRAQTATCITLLPPADLSIARDLGTLRRTLSRAFDLVLPVVNSGGITAIDTHAELVVPPSVIIDDVFVAGGTCTSGGGRVSCDMGDIAGGAKRDINLTLISNTLGSNSFSLQVSANGEAVVTNNSGDGTIIIEPAADLSIALQTMANVAVGTNFDATFTVANLTANTSGTVRVDIELPVNLTGWSAAATGATCTVQLTAIRCQLNNPLAANASLSGSVTLTAQAAGTGTITARVTGSFNDPGATNNEASRAVTVAASPVIGGPGAGTSTVVTRSKHHGLGHPGMMFLLSLASLAAARRLTRHQD